MDHAGVLGREVERARMAAFVDEVRAGSRVLALAGDPGIGKSTLWRLGVQLAVGSGFRVLTTRPVAAEAKLAFSGLTDLFDGVEDDVLACLPEPQRRALASATLRATRRHHCSDPRAVAAATVSTLRRLSQHGPVLVAVDDLQWLDPATARTIEAVVRRLGAERIGVLVCERDGPERSRATQLVSATPPDRVDDLRLSAMGDRALQMMVQRRLGRTLPLRTHRRIQEVARGNPFFTLELVGALPEEGVTGAATISMSPSLRELVQSRLATLDAHPGDTLLAAAAAERPTVELVAAGSAVQPSTALRELEDAAAAGVVELSEGRWVRFVHPLYAAGVYEAASPDARRAVHRRLAAAVDGIELRARHLGLASPGPDPRLAELIDRAAEHARTRGAPDQAAVLAVQARRLTPARDEAALARRTLTVARFRCHAGELEAAGRMLVTLLEGEVDSATTSAARCLLGEIGYHQRGFGDAGHQFTAAARAGSKDPDVACRVEMHLAYLAANTDHFDDARRHAQRALATSALLSDDALRAEALAVAVIADYMSGLGLDETRLRESLALEDPFHQVVMALRPGLIAGLLMLYEGRLAEAVRLLEDCRDAALDRGEEIDSVLVTGSLTWAECWRGRLDEASRQGLAAIEVGRRLRTPGAEGNAAAYLSAVDAYRGDGVAARSHADRALLVTEESGSGLPAMWARWGLGLLALGEDDPASACDVLEPLSGLVGEDRLEDPIRAIFLADQIEALVGVGELTRAERLTDLLEESASRLRRPWAMVGALRSRALLAAARGDLETASKAASAARDWCVGLELRLEVARTLLVSGRIERRRRRKRVACVLLSQAQVIFDEAGARPWSQRTREELDRAGPPRAADAGLTPTERLVAELSATGLTNRDVAGRLNISPKTVEANLSRVYRKIGIHSRAQLGSAVRGETPAATVRSRPTA